MSRKSSDTEAKPRLTIAGSDAAARAALVRRADAGLEVEVVGTVDPGELRELVLGGPPELPLALDAGDWTGLDGCEPRRPFALVGAAHPGADLPDGVARFEPDAGLGAVLAAWARGVAAGNARGGSRYENLVRALPDLVYELDVEGRFVFVNEAIGLLGYRKEDLVGKHFSVLLHEQDANAFDRDSVLGLFKGVRTGPNLAPRLFNERRGIDRRTENLEVRLKRAPGASPPEDMIATVIAFGEVSSAGEYSGGDFVGSVGIVRDITLRLKSEETLRKLYLAVEQLSSSVLVADASFVVEYANPAFFAMTGLEPPDAIGKDLFRLLGFDHARARKVGALVLDGFDTRQESSVPRGNGTPVRAVAAFSPVRSPRGGVTHAVAILEDSSERRASEELLRAAKEEAERSARIKNDFLANMSHELRSPLAGIVNAAELVKLQPEESARLADSIEGAARKLLETVRGILDYARSESDGFVPRPAPFRLVDFLEKVCASHRAEAARRGIAFTVEADGGETVVTDAELLGRAVGALVENAVKFTEEGTISVIARVDRKPGNPPWLSVRVADTGIGIDEELEERVYEPFHQGESGFSRNSTGAGLGLALARNVVRQLGGEIGFARAQDGGTIFQVLVAAGVSVPPERGDADAGGERGLSVLVVDDNEVNLEYLRAVFESRGHRVHAAMSGMDALRIIDERLLDAAVVDIQMPGMSGVELAGRIRSSGGRVADPDMPIVALTAYDPAEIERSGVRFDAVYQKPADANRLIGAVGSLVSRLDEFSTDFFDRQYQRDAEGRRAAIESARRLGTPSVAALLAAASREPESSAREAPVDFRGEAERFRDALARVGAGPQARAVARLTSRFPTEERSVVLAALGRLSEFWERALAALEGAAS
ncbi:MAG: PAS domain S-box protein [Spirochaetales bacterium]|nr:PAS domain S-box protein [Spirochaetales bacterium]